MSTTPKRVVTEAHRAAAIAALEEAGISVEFVFDVFNIHYEYWNLGHCRKALRKAGLSAAEAEAVLAEADTAPASTDSEEVNEDGAPDDMPLLPPPLEDDVRGVAQ